jgi:hypothetical protein
MKKLFLFCLFIALIAIKSNAQAKINFMYDAAGNQTSRFYCTNCGSTPVRSTEKTEKVQEKNFQKFFPEDVLSYYPNPVKDELYLKWELVNNIKVTTIDLYSVSGQLIKQINEFNTANTHIISFNELAVGMYLLNLNYSNGEVKTINIAKQ